MAEPARADVGRIVLDRSIPIGLPTFPYSPPFSNDIATCASIYSSIKDVLRGYAQSVAEVRQNVMLSEDGKRPPLERATNDALGKLAKLETGIGAETQDLAQIDASLKPAPPAKDNIRAILRESEILRLSRRLNPSDLNEKIREALGNPKDPESIEFLSTLLNAPRLANVFPGGDRQRAAVLDCMAGEKAQERDYFGLALARTQGAFAKTDRWVRSEASLPQRSYPWEQ